MATAAEINSLYSSLLGRAPDPSGLNTYSKLDVNAARNSILGSPEYAQRQQKLSNAGVDFAKEQSAALDALIARQKGEQEGLFSQYEQRIKSQEQLPALYQRLQQEQGIPEITNQLQGYKDEVYRVKGLLDRLDENVTSRNIGTYATQALRDRIAASEGQGLRTDLSRLGTGMEPLTERLTAAQGQISALLPLYIQQQTNELKPLEMRISAAGDQYAREITGFTSNRELQLNALMDKLDRDRQLSDREWELAQQLASEERQKNAAAANIAQYLKQPQLPTIAQPSPQNIRQLPGDPGNPAANKQLQNIVKSMNAYNNPFGL